MASSERRFDQARQRADQATRRMGSELRAARLMAGRSQLDVAIAARISQSQLGRIELGENRRVSVETLTIIGAMVGVDVVINGYAGPRVLRDGAQVQLLARLRDRLGPAWAWRYEIPVAAGDQRAWDAHAPPSSDPGRVRGGGRDTHLRRPGAASSGRPETRRGQPGQDRAAGRRDASEPRRHRSGGRHSAGRVPVPSSDRVVGAPRRRRPGCGCAPGHGADAPSCPWRVRRPPKHRRDHARRLDRPFRGRPTRGGGRTDIEAVVVACPPTGRARGRRGAPGGYAGAVRGTQAACGRHANSTYVRYDARPHAVHEGSTRRSTGARRRLLATRPVPLHLVAGYEWHPHRSYFEA